MFVLTNPSSAHLPQSAWRFQNPSHRLGVSFRGKTDVPDSVLAEVWSHIPIQQQHPATTSSNNIQQHGLLGFMPKDLGFCLSTASPQIEDPSGVLFIDQQTSGRNPSPLSFVTYPAGNPHSPQYNYSTSADGLYV